MLGRLKLRSEQPDFGKEDIVDQREAKVINKINCIRMVGSALGALQEFDPNTIDAMEKHLSQLEQLSGIRKSEYYNFVPKNE